MARNLHNKKLSYRRGTARRAVLVNSCYISGAMRVIKVSNSLQFLTSVLIFAFCFHHFPDCCKSLIRYPFLFLLRLDASNRFSGCFQQVCLGTFPEIFWGYLILQCHLCCKLCFFLFLEFLEIQRRNAVLSLSFSQPDFQRRHEQLMICVQSAPGYVRQFVKLVFHLCATEM